MDQIAISFSSFVIMNIDFFSYFFTADRNNLKKYVTLYARNSYQHVLPPKNMILTNFNAMINSEDNIQYKFSILYLIYANPIVSASVIQAAPDDIKDKVITYIEWLQIPFFKVKLSNFTEVTVKEIILGVVNDCYATWQLFTTAKLKECIADAKRIAKEGKGLL